MPADRRDRFHVLELEAGGANVADDQGGRGLDGEHFNSDPAHVSHRPTRAAAIRVRGDRGHLQSRGLGGRDRRRYRLSTGGVHRRESARVVNAGSEPLAAAAGER